MERASGHRKRVRHFDRLGEVRELTFSCYQRLPLLTNDSWQQMLAESIDRAMKRHRWRLTAFVFMPEHVHLIVYPEGGASGVDALLKAIKRPFSYRIKALLVQSGSRLLDRLTIQQRPGVSTFRYWQEGPGYDRNLATMAAVLAAIDYVHLNPVRRGLVERATQWEWSSARYYLAEPPGQYVGPAISRLPAHWLLDGQ